MAALVEPVDFTVDHSTKVCECFRVCRGRRQTSPFSLLRSYRHVYLVVAGGHETVRRGELCRAPFHGLCSSGKCPSLWSWFPNDRVGLNDSIKGFTENRCGRGEVASRWRSIEGELVTLPGGRQSTGEKDTLLPAFP